MEPPDQAPKPDTIAMNESVVEPAVPADTLGNKRPASEPADRHDGSHAGDTEGAQHAGVPSLKRLKTSGSPNEIKSPEAIPAQPEPEQTGSAPIQALSGARSGWNQGIVGGLRTSFGAKEKARKLPSRQASESPAQAAQAPTTETTDIDDLEMPPEEASVSKSTPKGAWPAIFRRWCVRLLALNQDQAGLRNDPAMLKEAWGLWLEARASLPRGYCIYATKVARNEPLDSNQLGTMFSAALKADLQAPWNVDDASLSLGPSKSVANESNGSPSLGGQGTNAGWVLPPLPPSSEFDVGLKDERAWEIKFLDWCRTLIGLNADKIKVDSPKDRSRVTEAYSKWVGKIDGLVKSRMSAARRVATHYAQDNSALLVALFFGTPPGGGDRKSLEPAGPTLPSRPPAPPSVISLSSGTDEEEGEARVEPREMRPRDSEEEYCETYYPDAAVSGGVSFCHACASRSHSAAECPEKTCRFCGDREHRTFACPTRVRCTKCKQLGHRRHDCREKLVTPADQLECAFCASREHGDASCHELWRSVRPAPDTVRKVRELPIYCYNCGYGGHYGPACGLLPVRTKEGPWETWSRANAELYQDAASSEVAVAFESSRSSGSTKTTSGRPDFGKSIVPQRHIFFEEDDDEDDDNDAGNFIRPPVQRNGPQRVGHHQISFAGGQQGHQGRPDNQQQQQQQQQQQKRFNRGPGPHPGPRAPRGGRRGNEKPYMGGRMAQRNGERNNRMGGY
ncbi:uncharacterized protein C8A04DRAFT_11600 [Dichotomopilus funicola]|uniref:CCHC-type domain-containing protein n=1 Tax=Dichotomopilus funicola TaxID=1934379 RepID=A0AAN6V679_9PEZI|nr:hypothetical protein C8A04DRAFT_11600 [Dichotomopilus funicola]